MGLKTAIGGFAGANLFAPDALSARIYSRPRSPHLVALARLIVMAGMLCGANAVLAVEYVSVGEGSAILYDAPSVKAKKLFVVNRYMPFEQIVTLDNWVKVRDRSGALYWIEKRVLSGQRHVFALPPVLEVRAEPDHGAASLFRVRQQVALEYLEAAGDGWVKVRHQDGDIGYVSSADVWGD